MRILKLILPSAAHTTSQVTYSIIVDRIGVVRVVDGRTLSIFTDTKLAWINIKEVTNATEASTMINKFLESDEKEFILSFKYVMSKKSDRATIGKRGKTYEMIDVLTAFPGYLANNEEKKEGDKHDV